MFRPSVSSQPGSLDAVFCVCLFSLILKITTHDCCLSCRPCAKSDTSGRCKFRISQIMSCFVAANSSISLGFLLSFQYIYYILAVMIEPSIRLGIRHSRYSEGNGAQKIG